MPKGPPIDDTPRLGVVSDTHGRFVATQRAVSALAQLDVRWVVHCGDIGSPDIVPLFAHWSTHFVFGNVDTDERALRRAIDHAGQTCHERFGELELAGRRISFLHGDDTRRLDETAGSGDWDLVCYGHTHVAEMHRQESTLVLNPGAVHRARRHSVAVVDLREMVARHIWM